MIHQDHQQVARLQGEKATLLHRNMELAFERDTARAEVRSVRLQLATQSAELAVARRELTRLRLMQQLEVTASQPASPPAMPEDWAEGRSW